MRETTDGAAERDDRAPDVDGTRPSSLVRPLGALERMWYRFGQRRPEHFLVAAEFDVALDEQKVRAALAAVQGRHPLLRVGIADDPEAGPVFIQPEEFAPVPLSVVRQHPYDWQRAAEREFAQPIDVRTAPLARAVLVTGENSSALLLAFDHTICDGMSAVSVIDDLTASLNGRPLPPLPVPPSHEDLVTRRLPAVDPAVLGTLPQPEPRMRPWPNYLPYGSASAAIDTLTLDEELTAAVVARCRAEATTVQALLVAAFSRVRATLRKEEFVRVLTPINTRDMIGADATASLYITIARTGSAPRPGDNLWEAARAVGGEIAGARSELGVAIGSLAVEHFVPTDATSEAVEQFMNSQLTYETQVSNLGVLSPADSGPVRPVAVWGPMLLLQIDGEANVGVTTYEGRLRIVCSGFQHNDDLLEGIRQVLVDACGQA